MFLDVHETKAISIDFAKTVKLSVCQPTLTGWWFSHPSEKYEFANWDDSSQPNISGKIKK